MEGGIRTKDGLIRTLNAMRTGVPAPCATPDHPKHGGPQH